MPKYLIETVSMFRIRYVVEARTPEDACDEVVMMGDDLKEFGQKHIDENIIGVREVADEDIGPLFCEDHPYLSDWGDERAFEQVSTVIYDFDE